MEKDNCPQIGHTCSYCHHSGSDVHTLPFKELRSQRMVDITACDDIDSCLERSGTREPVHTWPTGNGTETQRVADIDVMQGDIASFKRTRG